MNQTFLIDELTLLRGGCQDLIDVLNDVAWNTPPYTPMMVQFLSSLAETAQQIRVTIVHALIAIGHEMRDTQNLVSRISFIERYWVDRANGLQGRRPATANIQTAILVLDNLLAQIEETARESVNTPKHRVGENTANTGVSDVAACELSIS